MDSVLAPRHRLRGPDGTGTRRDRHAWRHGVKDPAGDHQARSLPSPHASKVVRTVRCPVLVLYTQQDDDDTGRQGQRGRRPSSRRHELKSLRAKTTTTTHPAHVILLVSLDRANDRFLICTELQPAGIYSIVGAGSNCSYRRRFQQPCSMHIAWSMQVKARLLYR